MFGNKRFIFLLLTTIGLTFTAAAQQSSKSKSKSKLYEKPGENKNVRVRSIRSVNSPNTDYSPVYYQNGLVFVSSRRNAGPQAMSTGETFYELYFAPFDPNGDPTTPQNFSLEINSALHEGPVTFSRDWQTIFFTRNNTKNGVQQADNKGIVRLKIYEAQRGANDWTRLRELAFNSDDYSCMHPSLSADGNRLYFASDMPGGYGGFDLYVSERMGEGWSKPVNLGSSLNSPKNEVFPFIHPSGTLFFSSNGHNTMGGLDLFFAEKTGDDWDVTNLGEKFNSPKDDLGIITNDDVSRGFFSSDRTPGYGKDDIYSFEVENGIAGVQKPQAKQVKIQITDAKTGQPVRGAAIRIFEPSGDGYVNAGKRDLYDVEFVPDPNGGNTLTLKLIRKNAANLGDPDLYTNAGGEAIYDFMQYRNYLLVVAADGYRESDKVFTLDPDDESGTLTLALEEYENCTPMNGTVATDQHGTRIPNAVLRFTHVSSNRQGMAYSNLNGEFGACLPGEGEYAVAIEREGFEPNNFIFSVQKTNQNYVEWRLKPTVIGVSSSAEKLLTAPVTEGAVIVMENIYYDYNKATLNTSAVTQLNKLVNLMQQYPLMEIDLISHTDTRGDARGNLKLSQERADNAKKYLQYFGIQSARVTAIGKGESEPRNHCADGVECSEEDHRYNRRTEIKIKKLNRN